MNQLPLMDRSSSLSSSTLPLSSSTTLLTFLCPVLLLTSASLFGNKITPQKATYDVPTINLASVPQVAYNGESVWIKVRIIQQLESDTYLVEDISGQIILFLSNDELINLDLTPGQEILVWGKIDLSQVHPAKNEFYADRILLPK